MANPDDTSFSGPGSTSLGSGGNSDHPDSPARGQIKGAEKAFNETSSDLSQKAGELAGEAKEAVLRKAEDARHGLTGSIMALAGALRAAGDHLSQNGQSGPSKLVGEAGSGLERFADSLENKPFGEVFEELRTLGRSNAGGLFAGSVLAGLALGRLLRSSDLVETGGSQAAGDEKSGTGQSQADRPAGSDGAATGDFSGERSPAPPMTATSGYAL